MGRNIFGIDVAGIVLSALDGQLSRGTLLVPSAVDRRTGGDPTGGVNEEYVEHRFQGFEDSIEDTAASETGEIRFKKVLNIIGDSLPAGIVPMTDYRAQIDGSADTLIIGEVGTDPALAMYVCAIIN